MVADKRISITKFQYSEFIQKYMENMAYIQLQLNNSLISQIIFILQLPLYIIYIYVRYP